MHKKTPFNRVFKVLAAGALSVFATVAATTSFAELKLEKDELKFGFIKLTDMAPLAIAYEKGFFEDEGLFVTLEAQANWKVLLDRTIDGELDGAHMLAGQPLGATIGFGTQAHVVTAFSMDLNGNGITVSNSVWAEMKKNIPHENGKPVHPIKADALKPVIDDYKKKGKQFKMGMVFPVSTHNYELRYWLAAGGINPGYYAPHQGDTSGTVAADALLSVTPPPQMPATLEAGTIHGYCVGEPWNQQAVFKGIGVPVITDYEIWKNNPEKVFGVSNEWAEKYPNTHLAVVKALIRAAKWLDENNNANREEETTTEIDFLNLETIQKPVVEPPKNRFSIGKKNDTLANDAQNKVVTSLLHIGSIPQNHWLGRQTKIRTGDVLLSADDVPCYNGQLSPGDISLVWKTALLTKVLVSDPIQDVISSGTAAPHYVGITTCTLPPTRLESIRKKAVAVGGGALVGTGAVLMVTPLHPFGHAMAIGGLGVLGTEFEGPRKVFQKAKQSAVSIVAYVKKPNGEETKHDDDDDDDDDFEPREKDFSVPSVGMGDASTLSKT